jgi:hypothetical protein
MIARAIPGLTGDEAGAIDGTGVAVCGDRQAPQEGRRVANHHAIGIPHRSCRSALTSAEPSGLELIVR